MWALAQRRSTDPRTGVTPATLVETQRHLLLVGDAWLGNAVLEEEAPYDPLGFPYGGMPPDASAKLGLTLEATRRRRRRST